MNVRWSFSVHQMEQVDALGSTRSSTIILILSSGFRTLCLSICKNYYIFKITSFLCHIWRIWSSEKLIAQGNGASKWQKIRTQICMVKNVCLSTTTLCYLLLWRLIFLLTNLDFKGVLEETKQKPVWLQWQEIQ